MKKALMILTLIAEVMKFEGLKLSKLDYCG